MSKLDTYIQNKIAEQLVREVNQIVIDAKINASRISSRIPQAINIGKLDIRQGYARVTIEVDASEDGPAPHAAAVEFGSGLFSETESPEKYRIKPKNAQALAFFWEKTPYGPGPKYIGQMPDGIKLFRYVDHPGVKPRPYLRPAIRKNRSGMIRNIAKAFLKGYRDATPRVIVIK